MLNPTVDFSPDYGCSAPRQRPSPYVVWCLGRDAGAAAPSWPTLERDPAPVNTSHGYLYMRQIRLSASADDSGIKCQSFCMETTRDGCHVSFLPINI